MINQDSQDLFYKEESVILLLLLLDYCLKEVPKVSAIGGLIGAKIVGSRFCSPDSSLA